MPCHSLCCVCFVRTSRKKQSGAPPAGRRSYFLVKGKCKCYIYHTSLARLPPPPIPPPLERLTVTSMSSSDDEASTPHEDIADMVRHLDTSTLKVRDKPTVAPCPVSPQLGATA